MAYTNIYEMNIDYDITEYKLWAREGNWSGDFLMESTRLMRERGVNVRDIVRHEVSAEKYREFDFAFSEYLGPDSDTYVSARNEKNADIAPLTTCRKDGAIVPVREIEEVPDISADALDRKDIPPIEWLVEGLLPKGVIMLAAPPKYFKSYMALQLCIALCEGGMFLGRRCSRCSCLYFDLESTERRPKTRLGQIMGERKKPSNLYFVTGDNEVGRLGSGFEKQIEYKLKKHPDIGFIVIDVFQKVRPEAVRAQSWYDRDYEDIGRIRAIADAHDISIMIIHHTRKMKDPYDGFNNISGSTGLLGSVDCAWMISKEKRNSKDAVLNVTGKDMDDSLSGMAISFNKERFIWEYLGTAEEIEDQRKAEAYDADNITKTIRLLVRSGGGHWEGSPTEIKDASKYLSSRIYDDPGRIGSFIRENEHLLFLNDRIKVDFTRSGSKRLYKFDRASDGGEII